MASSSHGLPAIEASGDDDESRARLRLERDCEKYHHRQTDTMGTPPSVASDDLGARETYRRMRSNVDGSDSTESSPSSAAGAGVRGLVNYFASTKFYTRTRLRLTSAFICELIRKRELAQTYDFNII